MKTSMPTYFACVVILFLSIAGCTKHDSPLPPAVEITIPNNDFENWTVELLPENWQTNSCPLCVPQVETYIVQKDTQVVYHGKYSMKLINNLTDSVGYAPAWAKNKFVLSAYPSILHGYVKCNLMGIDTVSIKIEILLDGTPINGGQWKTTSSINNWTEVNIPISDTIPAFAFDSALITITGGKYKDSTINLSNSTTLWVDKLSLFKKTSSGYSSKKK